MQKRLRLNLNTNLLRKLHILAAKSRFGTASKGLTAFALLLALSVGFPASALAANNYDCGAYGSNAYGSRCAAGTSTTTNSSSSSGDTTPNSSTGNTNNQQQSNQGNAQDTTTTTSPAKGTDWLAWAMVGIGIIGILGGGWWVVAKVRGGHGGSGGQDGNT